MAIIPSTLYAGRIDTGDANYPLGKAQDESSPGADDGTPYTAAWRNDVWGFLQALLAELGVAADGNPEQVGASQYLDTLKLLIEKLTHYQPSDDSNTAISLGTPNHLNYRTLTNASPITVTMLAPVSALGFGESIVLEKGAGSGDITIQGDAGITIEGQTSHTTDGKVISLVCKSATVWRVIS